jgi:putative tryptophan/tyrosine transport system substrate-binding protein
MKRRKSFRRSAAIFALLTGAAMSPQFACKAAGEPVKVFRLGAIAAQPPSPKYRAFEERLRQLLYEEGRDLQIDIFPLPGGDTGPDPAAMAAALHRGLDAIIAIGPEVAVKSALAATRAVPIVMLAIDYDPVARGYVAGLARPGGNVTGVFFQQIELTAKRLELLGQTVPELARVVVLWDRISAEQFEAAREAARSLKIPLHGIECADPPYDYERALGGVDGGHRDVLLQMARLAAGYVAKILQGANPADLPVQQPTRFLLGVNLKTATVLGLTIPPAILDLANEVIE